MVSSLVLIFICGLVLTGTTMLSRVVADQLSIRLAAIKTVLISATMLAAYLALTTSWNYPYLPILPAISTSMAGVLAIDAAKHKQWRIAVCLAWCAAIPPLGLVLLVVTGVGTTNIGRVDVERFSMLHAWERRLEELVSIRAVRLSDEGKRPGARVALVWKADEALQTPPTEVAFVYSKRSWLADIAGIADAQRVEYVLMWHRENQEIKPRARYMRSDDR